MKKWIALLLCFLMMLGCFTGCARATVDAFTWEEYYELGVRYLGEGNYKEAILAFEAAIEIDPKQPQGYTGLAKVYLKQGDYDLAREVLENALEWVEQTWELEELLKQIEGETAEPEHAPEPENNLEPTPEPELEIMENIDVTAVPFGVEVYGETVMRFEVVEQWQIDLDSCGHEETVAQLILYGESRWLGEGLRVIKGDRVYDTPVECTTHPGYGGEDFKGGIWIADLNEDGIQEMVTTGDAASSDFVTGLWQFMNDELTPLGDPEWNGRVASGRVVSIENGVVVIEEYMQVLCTWRARREFVYSATKGLEPKPGSLWRSIKEPSYGDILQSDLPILIDGVKTTLPKGTAVSIVAYDGANAIWLETADGRMGQIYVERVPDGVRYEQIALWTVEGRPEYEFFGDTQFRYVG